MVTCVTPKIARIAAISTVPVVAFAMASCSSTSGTSNGTNTASASASASSSSVPTEALKTTNLQASDVQVSGLGPNMTVTFPFPSSASQFSQKDIKVGKGGTAALNKTITVNYYLAGALTGSKIESSFGAQEATFPLQEGGLIEGWVKGIPGMKVGGERILVVPGALGYPEGNPPQIQPNETLVFVVQLLKVGA